MGYIPFLPEPLNSLLFSFVHLGIGWEVVVSQGERERRKESPAIQHTIVAYRGSGMRANTPR